MLSYGAQVLIIAPWADWIFSCRKFFGTADNEYISNIPILDGVFNKVFYLFDFISSLSWKILIS